MDDDFDYDDDDAYHDDSSGDATAPSETDEAKGDRQPAAASQRSFADEGAQEWSDEELAGHEDDGAETYVPQSVDEDDGATYAPQLVDDDGFPIERQAAAAATEEQPVDERECAVDELAQFASTYLKFPNRFGELRGRLENRIARRIAMQVGQKTRRLFGRWLRDFADRACATYGPEELLYLCTISTRHDHPEWSTAMWQKDADELRDVEGRLHEWAEYADDE